jgi:hypothetical protein
MQAIPQNTSPTAVDVVGLDTLSGLHNHVAMTSKGATIDIGAWLRELGLGQYEAAFRDNEIDDTVLRNLTAEDLKDVGVSIVGHRRKLLDAIAGLHTGQTVSGPAPPSTVVATAAPTPEAAGERRHVTVMFCDLADSTGIAARLDAEEWRDLLGAYLDSASAAVTDMGGKVAKKLGDGLMALFGYPLAQENDSERAVRAALSIQRALAELNRKNEGAGRPALAARIAMPPAAERPAAPRPAGLPPRLQNG